MAEIVNIVYNGFGKESQTYNSKDTNLITSNYINVNFGDPADYVEYFIYDQNGNLLDKTYNALNYKPNNNFNPENETYGSITIDPQSDLKAKGYNRGSLNIQYNFLRNLFNSSYGSFYFIEEISTSRTELKLSSVALSNTQIQAGFNQYQAYVAGLNYYNDFYLNFGDNQHIIAVNVAYTEDAQGSYIIVKLYEPLPSEYDVKTQLWLVEKIAEPVSYNVDIEVEAENVIDVNALRGPNFNVKINQRIGQTTPYYNYDTLLQSPVSSSFNQLMSYYQDKAVNINVDYSDFSNFVHFSSATQRINNFAYKVGLIESYNAQIKQQQSIAGGTVTAATIGQLSSSIAEIITNFDTYEYFLYYNSGSSFSWPKYGTSQPYSLYSVTSSQAINFLGSSTILPSITGVSLLYSASLYDSNNKDLLSHAVPQYILDDENNEPYTTFLNMVGQHFDNIWIYYKDVSNRYNNTNNPDTGISMDLVADALKGLGINLYTNTNLSDNLYYSLFGRNADGSLLPPTGSEHITNYVTSSLSTLSANDLQKEYYKRIYHNLPYLLKTKGTRNGIEALINIFGIPSSSLTINEFGGYDRASEIGLNYVNNQKISVNAQPLEISASLLSPYTTVQYFNNEDKRDNSLELEVGYSPANTINNTISASLGYFNIDQYVGRPVDQYSGSYPLLDQAKNSLFNAYNYSHSIHEYIRLIKYFNNTLFKMVHDFVPARADLSTGIIIKPHVLERNKYARHEPVFDNSKNYSQSIDLVSVTGSDAPVLNYPTNYTESIPTVSGSVTVNHSYSWEKYTGEFGGTIINAETNYFSQEESSSMAGANTVPCYTYSGSVTGTVTITYIGCDNLPYTRLIATLPGVHIQVSVCAKISTFTVTPGYETSFSIKGQCGRMIPTPVFSTYNLGALYQNINHSVKSTFLSEADYAYSQTLPTNAGLIASQSKCENCYRVDCLNYYLYTEDASSQPYRYQNCQGNYIVGTLVTSGSLFPCVKPGTLVTSSAITASVLGNCGFTHSSTFYGSCYITSIYNQGASSFGYTWTACDGTAGSATIGPSLTSSPLCIRRGTMGPGLVMTPPTYSIIESEECGVWNTSGIIPDPSSSFCKYLDNLTIPATPSYNISYLNCKGDSIQLSGSIGLIGLLIEDCIRWNTLRLFPSTITYVTGSGNCGYHSEPVEYTGSRPLAEVQDYNYNRTSTVNSRYAGAKSISAKYNTFTPGDSSYKSYPAIDYYADYIGLFTHIESSSYFPDQMTAKVAYLADLSGGLKELNLENKNWVYFQNLYKAGSNATVKQFNSNKFSNQKYLDKTWKIVESGWSYLPYWYRNKVDSLECYDIIVDSYSSLVSGSYAKVYTSSPTTASGLLAITANLIESTGSFRPNLSGLYVEEYTYPTITSSAYLGIYGNSRTHTLGNRQKYYTSLWWYDPSIYNITDVGSNLVDYYIPYPSPPEDQHIYITGSYYLAPNDGEYSVNASFAYNYRKFPTNYDSSISIEVVKVLSGSLLDASLTTGTVVLQNAFVYPSTFVGQSSGITSNNINDSVFLGVSGDVSLNAGDKLFFRIATENLEQTGGYGFYPYIAGFSYEVGVSTVNGGQCIDPSSSYSRFISSSYSDPNSIPITTFMSSFFTGSTYYTPYTDYYISSLYERFGDINYSTNIESGDYITLYYSGSDIGLDVNDIYPIRRRVVGISDDGYSKTIHIHPKLPSYLNSSNIDNFKIAVLSKRIPDETILTLEGKKKPGDTSFGFVLAENITPTIGTNINSLQSTIQSQLLDFNNSGITP